MYAPSDSALNVVKNIAGRHAFTQRAAVSALVWELYRPYFPQLDSAIGEVIEIYKQKMLLYPPQPDIAYLYEDFIKKKAPTMDAFVAVERIAAKYIERREWDSAGGVYRKHMPLFPLMRGRFEKVLGILSAKSGSVEIRNFGAPINTSNAEWDPNPTGDGRYIFFSSSYRSGGMGKSDVWLSALDSTGRWAEPKPLNGRINGSRDETIDNITLDGNGIMLSGDFAGTYGNFDIYHAELTEKGWDEIIHYPRPINSEHTDEGGNLTADGKALLFTSDRPGGQGPFVAMRKEYHGNVMGNMDIYVCFISDTGWTKPLNLGSAINTPFAERSPYLHPDGKTLYFSSDGHPGLGKLDVFKSVRLKEDSWTEWSEPVNLGKEINTEKDDWGYKICLKGDSAVFAAQDRLGGYGDWDLYSVKLPDEAKPEQLVVVRGRVLNAEGKPLSAEVKWEDLTTGELTGKLRSSPRDGYYIIALPLGKNYGFFASKEGYYPSSQNLDLRKGKSGVEITRDITLISMNEMKSGSKGIRINNLFFDFDKSEPNSESYPELERLASFLKDAQQAEVIIEGHTDPLGSDEYNLELSERRAKSVKDYLVKKGLSKKIFKIKAFGSAKPVSTNDTEEGRALNRRVEIRFGE